MHIDIFCDSLTPSEDEMTGVVSFIPRVTLEWSVPYVGEGLTLSVTCMRARQAMRVGVFSILRLDWWGGMIAIPWVSDLF